jgi:lipoprotein NlpD
VTLPEGAIEVKPIAGPAPIVVVSDSGSPSVATAAPHAVAIAAPAPAPAASGSASPAVAGTPTAAGVGAESVKREPRGGTVAYSDTALDQARAMEGSEAPARPAEQPAPAPTPAPPAASAAPAAVPAGDGVDWTWPVAGKVIGAFVDGGGSKESNKGIDLAGRMGEPIRAAASGTVTYVGSLRGYGDFLVVRHNARYISVYAHTSKIMVKTDQKVAKGQTIAEVGSSDSDRPKLHFEIRQDSSPVDPLGLLPARQ